MKLISKHFIQMIISIIQSMDRNMREIGYQCIKKSPVLFYLIMDAKLKNYDSELIRLCIFLRKQINKYSQHSLLLLISINYSCKLNSWHDSFFNFNIVCLD